MSSTTPPPTRYTAPLAFLSSSSPVPFPSPSSSASASASASSSRGGKRKQVKNACVNCQKACKKCDDQRPCSRCVKYGIEDGCTNSQRKERKRKSESGNEDETASPKLSSSARVQLNFSSSSSSSSARRLRMDAASEDHRHPHHLEPTSLRFSARNGIRPFPKELLESLQDEHEHHPAPGTQQQAAPFVVASMCSQVTEEFRTLAQICSDLHTVISQPAVPNLPTLPSFRYPSPQTSSSPPPNFLYQRINPFGLGTDKIPRSPRLDSPPPIPIPQMSQSQFNNNIYQQQQQQQLQQQKQPIPIQIRRPSSPSELLLKPSSPIYSAFHQQLQQQQQQQQQQQGIPRDLMNRTPPEDSPLDPSADEFDKKTAI